MRHTRIAKIQLSSFMNPLTTEGTPPGRGWGGVVSATNLSLMNPATELETSSVAVEECVSESSLVEELYPLGLQSIPVTKTI